MNESRQAANSQRSLAQPFIAIAGIAPGFAWAVNSAMSGDQSGVAFGVSAMIAGAIVSGLASAAFQGDPNVQ